MTHRRLTLVVLSVLLALDILTKAVVSRVMFVGESRWLIHGWAALTYVRNTGVAFGLFPGKRLSFIILSVIGISAVLVYLLKHPPRLKREAWALGLFLGGAFGNLLDRIRWGEVVDFIELGPPPHTFAVFNVADMGVTFGVVLLLLAALASHKEPAAAAPPVDEPLAPAADAASEGDAPVAAAPDGDSAAAPDSAAADA